MAAITLDPRTTSLMMQDLQNETIKDGRPLLPGGYDQLVKNLQQLLAKARQAGMLVIYVRAVRRPQAKYAPRNPLGQPPADAPKQIVLGTKGVEVISEIAPRPDEIVIDKMTTSPFNNTDVEVYLRRAGITILLLTGFSTTGVVEASLRDAKDKDYYCVVVRDCCAATTAEEHNVCMDIIFPRFA